RREWLPDCLVPPVLPAHSRPLPPYHPPPPIDSSEIETSDQPNPIRRRSQPTKATGDARSFARISGSQPRMEGEADVVVGSCSKPCGPLEEYHIPDYILKPDVQQVIVDHAPRCPVVVFINSRSGGQLGSSLIKTYRELLN
ncbi:unnamed protein product, partial [Urochloa humidicola]